MTLTATMGQITFAEASNCLIAANFASHNAAGVPALAPDCVPSFSFWPFVEVDSIASSGADYDVDADPESFLSSFGWKHVLCAFLHVPHFGISAVQFAAMCFSRFIQRKQRPFFLAISFLSVTDFAAKKTGHSSDL